MKILLIHNFYGSTAPSGENMAYRAEAELLRVHNEEIIEFTRNSDEIRTQGVFGTLQGAISTVWNPFSYSSLKKILHSFCPDLVHVHNTFPLHSPSIFYAIKEYNIPTVMTLHNYRIACSAGTAMRGETSCMECIEKKSVLPALRYGCYRHSKMATAPIAAMIAFHTFIDTWRKNVDAFITLSEFQKRTLVDYGLPETRVHTKPHFSFSGTHPVPFEQREEKVIFIGRIYSAKGIHILVQAWKEWGSDAPLLEIIGDGPMKEELEVSIRGTSVENNIRFVGQLSHKETMQKLSLAKLLILPSICLEGFPMVVQEAYSYGVGILASESGSLPFLVHDGKTGSLLIPGSSADIVKKMKSMWYNQPLLKQISANARAEFETFFTAERNYSLLMFIYKEAIHHRQKMQ